MTAARTATQEPRASVTVQGRVVRAHVPQQRPSKPRRKARSTRGPIRSFSDRARRKMLEDCSRIDWETWVGDGSPDGALTGWFVTLTYPPDHPEMGCVSQHFESLWKRLQRHHVQAPLCCIWRREYTERGHPHLHALVRSPRISHAWLWENWQQVLGIDYGGWVRVRHLRSVAGAHRAVRYLSKPDPYDLLASAALETPPGPLLDSMSYSAEDTRPTGKRWGIKAYDHVPWAPVVTFSVPIGKNLWDLKRAARHVYPGINRRQAGFLLLTDAMPDWLAYLVHLFGPEAIVDPPAQ